VGGVDPIPAIQHPAAISVGSNPTFAGVRRTVEAYLLDWEGDLYGREIEVRAEHRLRGMVAFTSVDELLSAMADDVARTRALLGVTDPGSERSTPPPPNTGPEAQTRNR
jgi:riboflavin kinase/FMN adenylyltransferase